MPKFIYVMVKGNEKPARIEADAVESKHEETRTRTFQKLVLRKENQLVGEFMLESVDGWWIQEER